MIKTFLPDSPDGDIEEYCPHCDSFIGIIADEGEYQTKCPVCGKRLMLCLYCHDDFGDNCDWDPHTERCSRMSK